MQSRSECSGTAAINNKVQTKRASVIILHCKHYSVALCVGVVLIGVIRVGCNTQRSPIAIVIQVEGYRRSFRSVALTMLVHFPDNALQVVDRERYLMFGRSFHRGLRFMPRPDPQTTRGTVCKMFFECAPACDQNWRGCCCGLWCSIRPGS